MRRKLSTLWIVVMFEYLYCDVIGLMDRSLLRQYLSGEVGGLHMTQGFLLGGAILVQIPIGMILLSRVLPYRANRWANVTAGTIMTAVQFSSLFFGSSPTGYYIFFSIIEIACTALVAWYAWKWPRPSLPLQRQPESSSGHTADRVAALPHR